MDARVVVKRLERYYSNATSGDPFKVLISTVLSQRTKDENTCKASEKLFSVYRTPTQLAEANIMRIEELIKPVGFYRVKAKRIKESFKNYCGEIQRHGTK
jgi:endonuclease-3